MTQSSRRMLLMRRPLVVHQLSRRAMGVANKGPHLDPLYMWQKECIDRQLCDDQGGRLPGADWRITIAIANAEQPQAVRTLPRRLFACRAVVGLAVDERSGIRHDQPRYASRPTLFMFLLVHHLL